MDEKSLLKDALKQLDELFLLVVVGEFNSGAPPASCPFSSLPCPALPRPAPLRLSLDWSMHGSDGIGVLRDRVATPSLPRLTVGPGVRPLCCWASRPSPQGGEGVHHRGVAG